MNLERSHGEFGPTRWSLIGELRSGDEERRRVASGKLYELYWPPVLHYVRRHGKGREAAEEATQAFFCTVVLERGLLDKADPARGKLRSLILTALKNFLIDERRHDGKGPLPAIGGEASAREEELLGAAGEAGMSPEDAFHRRWRTRRMEEAMKRTQRHFAGPDTPGHWAAFEARHILPAMHHVDPEPFETLGPRLGFKTPADAAAAVQYVRKRYLMHLREVVFEEFGDSEEVERELREMMEEMG